MILDANLFHPYAKVAVNCVSKKEAAEFIAAVFECFPSHVRLSGLLRENNWDIYEGKTCYAFYHYTPESSACFVYSSSDFFKSDGYDIISIYDAALTECVVEDVCFDDTVCVDCLFGGEVYDS